MNEKVEIAKLVRALEKRVGALERQEFKGVIWLPTPILETLSAITSGTAEFYLSDFGVPDGVRLVVASYVATFVGFDADDTTLLNVATTSFTSTIGFGVVNSLGNNTFVAAPASYLPIYDGDRVRLTYTPTSPGAVDFGLRVYGYVR